MDRGAWWATVHRVTRIRTQLSVSQTFKDGLQSARHVLGSENTSANETGNFFSFRAFSPPFFLKINIRYLEIVYKEVCVC